MLLAFDKVPHSRLLYKLDYYGVRGQTNTWIKAFLSDRKQQVVLEGAFSNHVDVLSGAPQGTVLGPLLFLAYIYDLSDPLRSSDARLLYRTVNGVKDSHTTSGRPCSSRRMEAPLADEFQPV